MKILFYSSSDFTDCDFPLVKAFMDLGHDVTYLIEMAPYNKSASLFNIKKQIARNDIIPATSYEELKFLERYMNMNNVYIVNRTIKAQSSPQSLCLVLKTIRFIKRGGFDVLHTDVMLSMYRTLLFFVFSKWVLTVHDPFPHSGEGTFRRAFFSWIDIKRANKIVILNNKQLECFCDAYKLKKNNILVNRLSVYDNIRSFINPKIKAKPHNVLFFGRISPYKGVEYLCDAMLTVRKRIPDANLTIAGGGHFYFDISKYKEQGWIDLRNHYISMPELAEVLQSCCVVVCPYTDATQSGVVMTSFGMCKPVIASDVGGLSEMIESGSNGFLVPPKDSAILAETLIRFLSDNELQQQMCNKIKMHFFEGKHSWKSIAEKYVAFYN